MDYGVKVNLFNFLTAAKMIVNKMIKVPETSATAPCSPDES